MACIRYIIHIKLKTLPTVEFGAEKDLVIKQNRCTRPVLDES